MTRPWSNLKDGDTAKLGAVKAANTRTPIDVAKFSMLGSPRSCSASPRKISGSLPRTLIFALHLRLQKDSVLWPKYDVTVSQMQLEMM